MTTNIENQAKKKTINKKIFIVDGDPYYQKWADRLNKLKGIECKLVSNYDNLSSLALSELFDEDRSVKIEIIIVVGDIDGFPDKESEGFENCWYYDHTGDINNASIEYNKDYQKNSYTAIQYLGRHVQINKSAPIFLMCGSHENEKMERKQYDECAYNWIKNIPRVNKESSMKAIRKAIQQVKNS